MNETRDLKADLADPRAVCAALGLGVDPKERQIQPNGGITVRCPVHGGVSLSVTKGPDGTLRINCFGGCDLAGDVFHLIAAVHGLNLPHEFPDVKKLALELCSRPLPIVTREEPRSEPAPPVVEDAVYHAIWSFILERLHLRDSPDVAKYLERRRVYADAEAVEVRGYPKNEAPLVDELVKTFDRGVLEQAGILRRGRAVLDWPLWSLVIPWRDRFGQIHFVQRRTIGEDLPKYRSPRGRSPRSPFGAELVAESLGMLGEDAEIIVTEGALDALARRKMARERGERAVVIGLYSASSPEKGLPLDLFAGRRVVLALDSDTAGDRAAQKLNALLAPIARDVCRETPS